jgi:hypothetical protein
MFFVLNEDPRAVEDFLRETTSVFAAPHQLCSLTPKLKMKIKAAAASTLHTLSLHPNHISASEQK